MIGAARCGGFRVKIMEGILQDKIEVVTALYRILLNRDPDGVALAAWAGNEPFGATTQDILQVIIGSEEFQSKRVDFISRMFDISELRLVNDHSQFGEVGLLLQHMLNRGAVNKIVVDVGANGRTGSNSYDFLRHLGWKGLLIEANSRRHPVILREFAGTNFELVDSAVSDYKGRTAFHLGVNDDVSSLDAETAAVWGKTKGFIEVDVERLPTILATYNIPKIFDLLSIDAEGEDVRIFNDTVSAGYRPSWVIIEASKNWTVTSLDQLPFNQDVQAHYEIVDRTAANLILRCLDPLD